MWLIKLLVVLLVVYSAVVAAMFFAQTAMIFPARQVLPAGPPSPTTRALELPTPSGHRLRGLHIPAGAAGNGRLLILGFSGNAWNAAAAAEYLHELFPEADVVAFHYRGYPPSGGTAGAKALQDDALLIHDFARRQFGDARIIAVGFSIGSGVAAHLAGRRPMDGAILVTPFDSLAAVAAGHYPWLPVRLLFRHRMEAAEALRASRVPVAIVAGGRDTLIVPVRTQALRQAAPNLVFDRVIAEAGHNDIYDHPAFRRAMREAMAALHR